ncbi:protein adenylyltransferase SelO [Cumulibacter manganitolerans]|uniref:protein adenylyltransferase SelO n=1 Tax=Cumulibacter manganitolerans TaxID=1884992 RepID=UPI0012977378|nr:YdiU family protein [Cumulibacter manganitolerans]
MDWRFDNTYARELDGFYVPWDPAVPPAPRLVALNTELAAELGLDPGVLAGEEGVAALSGAVVPEGATPLAQAYSGHQFGQLSPMLGDGRAVLLGEIVDRHGNRRDIAFKGSGRTQFSRGGDGKAVLGPVLREYVVGEAMHALGIPTTRALAAATTGEQVLRDGGVQPGAILTRVAASHLRVGTFQMAAHHGTVEHVRRLADYAMARHYPEVAPGDYAGFLSAVIARQAELIASWMSIGFIHGVMNTDNMTISGETIDYGPCAFLDAYDEDQVFSSIDTGGRYRYGQQPPIALWNLSRFAETLLGLLAEDGDVDAAIADATERVEAFVAAYDAARAARLRAKLGLAGAVESDGVLIGDLLSMMAMNRLDFTSTFRGLARVLRGEPDDVREHVLDLAAYDAWQARWRQRLGETDRTATAAAMDAVNPVYIPRNHLVEEALAAAVDGDLAPFEQLLSVVREPFTERPGLDRYAEPAPAEFTTGYVTYCGT